jgi:peroxiredoxin Q/BCP
MMDGPRRHEDRGAAARREKMSVSGSAGSPPRGRVRVGDLAPDFALPTGDGRTVRLSDYRGKQNVVLYFYPKDNTPGCTAEACAFRDAYEVFKEAGAEVIGVSSDPPSSHQDFAQRHRLPFILLSDSDGAVRRLYGVPRTFGLIPGRVTYVIDRQGVVRHIFSSQFAPQKHIDEALAVLRRLDQES